MPSFSKLNLNPKILAALEAKGYTTPTPIQNQAIPPLLEGRDILGIAQTGTGKTAAFSLPILHNLSLSDVKVKSGGVRTLILTPTRELASQIAENIEAYGKDLGLCHAVIFGGVSERPQIASMQKGVDILIATPGRLLDLMNQGHIRYMQLEILVLDEADRMLDMGFLNDVKKIIAKVPEKRQTLFFSATMPDSISDLAHSILDNPVKIEITPQSTTVERIEQKLHFVEKGNKLSLLKHILKQEELTSALVFSKTKHGANRIVEFLEKNSISVAAIHGNKSQGAREKALSSFREGKVQVLVATDIAARGIDVPAISHVINYDIPMDPESYVHRIGRTARAGRQGIAISFCDPSERKLLQAVEKTIRSKIPADDTHPYHGVAAAPAEKSSSNGSNGKDSEKSERRPASGRKYGYAVNKERRISSAAPSSRRDSSDRKGADRRDDRRTGSDDRREPSTRNSNPRTPIDSTKSNLLNFIAAGKKTFRPKNDGASKKSGGFGFGSWFKKPAESGESRSRNLDDSFGNREPAPRERRPRPAFGGGERRPSSERSNFGGEERRSSGSNFGGERRPRPAFGGGDKIESSGSSFRPARPSFSGASSKRPAGTRSPSPKKRWQ